MPRPVLSKAIQTGCAVCIAAAVFSIATDVAAQSRVNDPAVGADAPEAPSKKPATMRAPGISDKPRWTDLSAPQREALAPLAGEWDGLSPSRKRKWLEVSSKFSSMPPEQQIRLQDRMRDWVTLSPAQRRIARENYSRAKKLDPKKKAAEWQRYQQLPEAQKKKLAEDASTKKKRITNLPPVSQSKENWSSPQSPRDSAAESVTEAHDATPPSPATQ